MFEKERTENVTPCSDLNQLLWKMLAFSFKSTEERNVDNADDKLVEIIRRSLVDGKLPCGVAFRIAEELDVSVRKVGKAANDMKIKISHCQLGCF
ncbi:MAG: hypothetical protein M1358_16355 [Chloroflexi bacterium]|nr:hypothetical protein [Chloroflexota bacterium]